MPLKRKTGLTCILIVLALLAAAGTGCSAHRASRGEGIAKALDGMRAAANRGINDQERLPLIRQTIDGLEAELNTFDGTVAKSAAALRSLNARPDTSRAQIEALLDEFEIVRKQVRQRIVQRHFELIALTNADEWSLLSSYERKALVAAEP